VPGHPILRASICVIFLAAALPSHAQSVTPISGSQMLFSDPAFGVSFRFPSGWSFTRVDPHQSESLAIAFINGRSESSGLRGLVTNETLPGLHSWPRTVFSGVEFAYDARPEASAQACQKLARESWDNEADSVKLNGVTYWHGTGGGGGMGTGTAEDIYATYIEASGACLRFDLVVVTCLVDGKERPRPLTTHEKELIHANLNNILNSVRVAPPAQ
jgi:hypothetical protein